MQIEYSNSRFVNSSGPGSKTLQSFKVMVLTKVESSTALVR